MKKEIILLGMVSVLLFGGCSTMNDPYNNRTLTYGGVGAASGAVIGHQIDHNNGALIGGLAGALIGTAAANIENNRQAQQQKIYQQQAIISGRNISNSDILKKQQEVELLENEISTRRKEQAEAAARSRALQELEIRKRQAESELKIL